MKSKVFQREEFNVKECFGSNEPSAGLRNDDIFFNILSDSFPLFTSIHLYVIFCTEDLHLLQSFYAACFTNK